MFLIRKNKIFINQWVELLDHKEREDKTLSSRLILTEDLERPASRTWITRKDTDTSRELYRRFFMIQAEVLQLPRSNLKTHTTIKRLSKTILQLRECLLDKLSSVEKQLLFKLVTFFLQDKSLRELSSLMLSSEKVTMESLPEDLVPLSPLLLTAKMLRKQDSNYHLVLERPLTPTQEP